MKVAVVGGASTYTPELVGGLHARQGSLKLSELVLLDPDVERLQVVGGLAGRILARQGYPGRLVLTGSREEAPATRPIRTIPDSRDSASSAATRSRVRCRPASAPARFPADGRTAGGSETTLWTLR